MIELTNELSLERQRQATCLYRWVQKKKKVKILAYSRGLAYTANCCWNCAIPAPADNKSTRSGLPLCFYYIAFVFEAFFFESWHQINRFSLVRLPYLARRIGLSATEILPKPAQCFIDGAPASSLRTQIFFWCWINLQRHLCQTCI